MQQFKIAIQGALSSKPDVRAIMRARAAKQRFPVAQWIEDLEKLQTTAIEISHKIDHKKAGRLGDKSQPNTPGGSKFNTPAQSRRGSFVASRNQSRAPSPVDDERAPSPTAGLGRNAGLGSRLGPGYRKSRLSKGAVSSPVQDSTVSDFEDSSDEEDSARSRRRSQPPKTSRPNSRPTSRPPLPRIPTFARDHLPAFAPQGHDHGPTVSPFSPSTPETPLSDTWLLDPRPSALTSHFNVSLLSLDGVKGEHTDYKLQQVSPFFTDPKKEYMDTFETKLKILDGKTSEDQLCIEEYLVKSEKTWFSKLRDAEMGRNAAISPAPSVFRMKHPHSPRGSIFDGASMNEDSSRHSARDDDSVDEFLLGDNYAPPTGLKHLVRLKIGDWPVYAILIGFVSYRLMLNLNRITNNGITCRVKLSPPTRTR